MGATGDERRTVRRRGASERGAVLVHVAVAMLGLLALTTLSIDLGVVWVARTQAQSAADAAALAGAVALAYVDPTNEEHAKAAAQTVAAQHTIWDLAATESTVSFDCPNAAPSEIGRCIRVEVGRAPGFNPLLPVYMARMFTTTMTAVRASGTAQILVGNSTSCLRPLAVADRWIENYPSSMAWQNSSRFDRYEDAGSIPPERRDEYIPPTSSSPGSGYTVVGGPPTGTGTRVRLHYGDLFIPVEGDAYYSLDLERVDMPGGNPESRYEESIRTCNGTAVSIGRTYPALAPHWESTQFPMQDLIASDPNAYWDGSMIQGSRFLTSPRLITIAVFDPDAFAQQPRPSMSLEFRVRNIVGLFIEQAVDRDLVGVIMPTAGAYRSGADVVVDQAAYLRTVALVR